MIYQLSPNHLNTDLKKVRFSNVSGFRRVGFQIPTVFDKRKSEKLASNMKVSFVNMAPAFMFFELPGVHKAETVEC